MIEVTISSTLCVWRPLYCRVTISCTPNIMAIPSNMNHSSAS